MPLTAALAVILLSLPPSTVQEPLCAITGRVVDSAGRALPGVSVTAGASPVVLTSDDGRFCIARAEPGRRGVIFRLAGFTPETVAVEIVAGRGRLVPTVTLAPAFQEEVVVTATRTVRLLDSVPVRTEVIGRDAIAASGARTLADAVEFTTGVRVENNCQNCNFSQIRLLGLEGPYTQILVDGQPMISSLAQVYGIEQIPARLIDRIEVVKGGGSALYGAGAVGGVVNIIPREARRTSGAFEVRAENGTLANGGVDWVSDSRLSFLSAFVQHDRVSSRDVDGDGFTEVSRRHLTASGLRFNRFVDQGRGKLTIDFTDIREARRGGDALDAPPHEALIAEDIQSRRDALSVSWRHARSPRLDYRLTAGAARTDRDSYYGTGRDPDAYGDTRNTLALADAQVNHYAGRHIVSWGGELSRDRTADRQPAYGRAVDVAYTNRALFLQDDWTIGRGWQMLSGLRADWPSALSTPIVSPRVAVMVSPADALDVRVSVARGFRAPQVFDEDLHLSSVAGEVRIIRLDPALREERATSLLAGFEWKPTAGRGQALVEANVFRTRLTDLFHAVEADDAATPELEFLKTNLGGATVGGVEVNLGWGIGDDLVIQGGFVVQRAEFDQAEPDFGSREFFRTPRRYGNLTARWRSHHGWEFFAGLRVTGSMAAPHYAGFIDADRLETTPAFTTIDVSVGRRLELGRHALVLSASARNLTNAYQRDLDRGPLRDASYVYGPRFPRSFGVLARVEF